MAEMILPGVYIEVRPEGLITADRVSVGNLGVVGTASSGPIGQPILLSSYAEALERFGGSDAFVNGQNNELTLVRALEQAYNQGASTVFAVRVTSTKETPIGLTFIQNTKAEKAVFTVVGETANTVAAILQARYHGTWGNNISVNVFKAEDDSIVQEEFTVPSPAPASIELGRANIAPANPRNRVSILKAATGQTKILEIVQVAPTTGQVQIEQTAGSKPKLKFFAGEEPVTNDKVYLTYVVPSDNSRKVSIRQAGVSEVYTVADGQHLVDVLNNPAAPSQLVQGVLGANPTELPKQHADAEDFREFGKGSDTAGSDGADAKDTDYKIALDQLLNEPAHIIVAAGMDNEKIAGELRQHCDVASTDLYKKDRIAVVGSKVGATFDDLRGHILNSDRLIFVGPGLKVTDSASGNEVTLPGAYTAAAVAGMLSARAPHISLTNKSVAVDKLETKFTSPQLSQLVQARILVLEERRGLGIRIVKGITTENGAFRQITTRRIVDYAKYGVRSAAEPYIGLLNNTRVRAALRTTINSFLAEMVDDEMLVSYKLDVTATRDEERKGIARVTMTLQPTFSIDFIKVTMFLE